MTAPKPTKIKLELLVDKKIKFRVEGLCYEEIPSMSTRVSWFNYTTPGDKKKGLTDAVTLFEKYSQMILYTNKNYAGKPYEIKMKVRREK